MATKNKGAQRLRKFLDDNDVTAADAARAMGFNPSSVHYWLHGQIVPRTRAQHVIAKWTGGAVPVEIWAEQGANLDKVRPFAKATGTDGAR